MIPLTLTLHHPNLQSIALSVSLIFIGWLTSGTHPAHAGPIRVFILAGQSNMEGQAVVDLAGKDYNDGRGTLRHLFENPLKANAFRHLQDADGAWQVRPDVWVRYQPDGKSLQAGPLSIGFTSYADRHHFGPELELGHVLGDFLDDQVLLIKTAWGGKSLHHDFRPPSSNGGPGPAFEKMMRVVRESLDHLATNFPEAAGQDWEISGFFWYQGWNDGVDPVHAIPAYEGHLVRLIQDVRRAFEKPNLPVVIGELTGPWVKAPPEWTQLRQAQAAAAAHPDLNGNVAFVPTRNFVRAPEDSPNPTHGHHEFGNAETALHVGRAMGYAMTSLLPSTHASFNPVLRDMEGWTVSIDPSLLEGPGAEEGQKALAMLANHLQRIRILVPEPQLQNLQSIGLWIEQNHPRLKSMQYHPSRRWLKTNRHDSRLVRQVHITQAQDLLSREQMKKHPAVILHELAHGFHDQFLTFDSPDIVAAYQQAKASGHYEQVLLYTGDTVRHYALSDPMEYFAEGTEAYFYRNDFFPFVRAELNEFDPTLHNLLEHIWEPTQR